MKKALKLYMSLFSAPLALVIAAFVIGDITSVSAAPPTEKKCTDGVDNDQDGLTDADDPDCSDGGSGGGGSKGRGENSPGIITLDTIVQAPLVGLFSDDSTNNQYVDSKLEGGDCVTIITPAEDGVDQGKLVFFAPFGPAGCEPQRQIKVAGSGQDLNGDDEDDPSDPDPDSELIDTRFGCNDVFPNDSPLPGGLTYTSCSLEVREYDGEGGFERTWIIEWPSVQVTHVSADVRQLDPLLDAEIFELVAPTKGKGKKDKVYIGFPTPLPFSLEVTRVR